MSSPAIPWSIIEAAIKQYAPAAVDAIASHLSGLGFDLGPMTPDLAKDLKAIDAEIDAKLEAAAVPKTDPAPPPKPSEP